MHTKPKTNTETPQTMGGNIKINQRIAALPTGGGGGGLKPVCFF